MRRTLPDSTPEADETLLARIRAEYVRDTEATRDWDALARADETFLAPGHQWPEGLKGEREGANLPCLEDNRTLQTVLLVTNDARQNRPGMLASPTDAHGTSQTAEVVQGLFRHIEYDSNADVVYDAALWGGGVPGKGYMGLKAVQDGPGSFDQKLLMYPIFDQASVVVDCGAQLPTADDALHVFVLRDLTWDAFHVEFDKSKASADMKASPSSWMALGHNLPDWVRADGCRIADYYAREMVDATLSRIALPPEAQGVTKDQLREATPGAVAVQMAKDGQTAIVIHTEALPETATVLQTAPTRYPRVVQYKLSAHEILDRSVWSDDPLADPDGLLPVVRVTGLRMKVHGKVDYVGLVRPVKDGQQLLNFTTSALAETLGAAPKAVYWVYEGQVTDPHFATINTRNHAAIQAKARPSGWSETWGPAPFPQRIFSEPPIQAITQALQIYGAQIQEDSGQFNAAKGQRSNETSGIAIESRKEQSNTVAYHLIDNFHQAMRGMAKRIAAQIPQRYDTARTLRIVGEDDQPRTVEVNQPTQHGGQDVFFDLTQGRYDFVLSAGPAYATKQKQQAALLPQLLQAIPAIGQDAPDLAAKTMGLDAEMSTRLKRGVRLRNPGVLGPADQEEGEQANGDPQTQALQGQLQQAQQQSQMVGMDKDVQMRGLDLKSRELDLKEREMGDKHEEALLKLDVQAAIEEMKLGHDAEMQLVETRLHAIEHITDLTHQQEQAACGHDRAQAMAQQGHDHQMQQNAAPPPPAAGPQDAPPAGAAADGS